MEIMEIGIIFLLVILICTTIYLVAVTRRKETLRDDFRVVKDELTKEFQRVYGDLTATIVKSSAETREGISDRVEQQLAAGRQEQGRNLESAVERLEKKFEALQSTNQGKLDEIKATVDEKLHDALEKRLGESFKLVSERLELVHRGLGEMQTLASGVGDLKKILTNVKSKGIWGEIQLGNLLEDILTPDQYAKNVAT